MPAAIYTTDTAGRLTGDRLAARGLVEKVYGGATSVVGRSTDEPGFEAKSVSLLSVGWNALKLAWKQNVGSAGARAEKGLRDALSERSPVDVTSMMGLGAMCPAGMRPKGGEGATPRDVGQLHASLHGQVANAG